MLNAFQSVLGFGCVVLQPNNVRREFVHTAAGRVLCKDSSHTNRRSRGMVLKD